MKFELPDFEPNIVGWNSEAPIFRELIERIKPTTIIEVGAWYGASTITMADAVKELGLDAKIISIDTWLGSLEHWEEYFDMLQVTNGYPAFYYQFKTNIISKGHQDIVQTLPMPSLQAARLLRRQKVKAQLIYLDASHEYSDVYFDLDAYTELLAPGGVIFGDDYTGWNGVRWAVDDFASHSLYRKTIRDGIFWMLEEEDENDESQDIL